MDEKKPKARQKSRISGPTGTGKLMKPINVRKYSISVTESVCAVASDLTICVVNDVVCAEKDEGCTGVAADVCVQCDGGSAQTWDINQCVGGGNVVDVCILCDIDVCQGKCDVDFISGCILDLCKTDYDTFMKIRRLKTQVVRALDVLYALGRAEKGIPTHLLEENPERLDRWQRPGVKQVDEEEARKLFAEGQLFAEAQKKQTKS